MSLSIYSRISVIQPTTSKKKRKKDRLQEAKTMKQKIVIMVSMHGQKSRSKALKIVVGVPGVQSAGLGKKDKNQIEVIGEGVDAVKLTSLLRKNLGNKSCLTCFLANSRTHAEIVSVEPLGGKADEEEEEKESKVRPVNWSYSYGCSVPQYIICY